MKQARLILVAIAWLSCSVGLAEDGKVKVAVIGPVNGSASHIDNLPYLRKHVTTARSIDPFSSVVRLQRAKREHISISNGSLQGACGRDIVLPRTWNLSDPNWKFYRGAVAGRSRPNGFLRERVFRAFQPGKHGQLANVYQWDMPSDFTLGFDSKQDCHLLIDWDYSLTSSLDEQFTIRAENIATPQFFRSGREQDQIVLFQLSKPSVVPGREVPDRETIDVQYWMPTKTGGFLQPLSLDPFITYATDHADSEFQIALLDTGRDTSAVAIAKAMHEAKELGCDFAFTRLAKSGFQPDALAQFSAEYKLPILVDQRSSYSPQFVIQPTPVKTIPERGTAGDEYKRLAKVLAELLEDRSRSGKLRDQLAANRFEIEPVKPVDVPAGLSELTRVSLAELPTPARNSAELLLQHSDAVHSWWYRSADRNGNFAHRGTFSIADPKFPWNPQHLTYREFYETGRCSRDPISMAKHGRSTPQTAWILLQAPVTKQNANWNAPKLAQRTLMVPADRQLTAINDDPGSWAWHYDRDSVAKTLKELIGTGQTPLQILSQYPQPSVNSDDIAAWRRHLLALDQPSLRKDRLDQIASVAQRVIDLCERRLGRFPAPREPYDRRQLICPPALPMAEFAASLPDSQMETYAWAVDAAYRRVRAIGYRELPDVVIKHPVRDWNVQEQEFVAALRQLVGLTPLDDPRFVLPLIRHERRRRNPRRAYELLQRSAYQGPAMPWYFKKERDLFSDAGWEPLRRVGYVRWFLKQNGMPILD